MTPTRMDEHRSAYAIQAIKWLREFNHAHGETWVRLQMDGIAEALADYGAELDNPHQSYYRLQRAADRAAGPVLRRGK